MAADDAGPVRPATRLVTTGRRAEWTSDPRLGGGVVNPPIWRASTILQPDVATLDARESSDTHDQFYYGRRGTPTVWALADALTSLEPGAAGTLLYPSGVAAIAGAMLAVLAPGDHMLMVDSAYGPTRNLCDRMLARYGVRTTYYDPLIGGGIADQVTDATRLIFMESPGSLTFEVQDVPAIVAVARERGIHTMIDNTWATPLLFAPVGRGVDISMMSLTKYVGGHSDAMMGSLTIAPGLWDRCRSTAYQLGQCVSPDDCALMLRGLRTLDVRLKRQQDSALAIAQWLTTHPRVGTVLHPALPDCPGHAMWRRDFSGSSGLFAFTLKDGDAAQRAAVIDALDLFGIGYSWGGFESLVVPADPKRSLPRADADPIIRLSIGLEDPADLIADLDTALMRIAGPG